MIDSSLTTPAGLAALSGFAETLADAAGAVARRYFRAAFQIERKPDASPVTQADREAESAMREAIAARYPAHGIIGEEGAAVRADAEFVWVLDPIDGTAQFVAGLPLFGTLIALCRNGLPILGVIDHPATRERWIGARGRGALYRGADGQSRLVHCRSLAALGEATLYTTSPEHFDRRRKAAFARVAERVARRRYGTDCYGYALIAHGCGDLVVESGLKPYDYMAVIPVIESAGGMVTDWAGKALTMTSDGTVLAAADQRVHAAARALLAG